jgi:DNA-directed RNA polymerase subunit RPC12/RpoP
MKIKKTRCWKGYAYLNGINNIEVYYIAVSFGYGHTLYTCKKCGEVFVIDFENPRFHNLSINEIVKDIKCPNCNLELINNILKYPETFVYKNELGHFVSSVSQTHGNSEIIEFYEIE